MGGGPRTGAALLLDPGLVDDRQPDGGGVDAGSLESASDCVVVLCVSTWLKCGLALGGQE